jgi:ribonuclease R
MVHKKKKKKKSSKKKIGIDKLIIDFLESSPKQSFNMHQIAHRIGMVKKKDRDILQDLLYSMVEKGEIVEPHPWKYMAAPLSDKLLEGRIEITKFGYGFVTIPQLDEDVFIPPKQTANALYGDTVKVELKRNPKGKKVEGVVVDVIEREREEFVGILETSKKFAFFIPDNQKIHVDFYIPLSKLKGAKEGEKVIVKLTDWPNGSKNPFGAVTKILGKAGEHQVEMHAIIEEFGLPNEFPKGIITEADAIPDEISEAEIKKRKDLRNVLTFTIDPVDAKDFDDAISFQILDNGNYEIGVHIADVTHYLKPGSDLDKEALRRATSVYLVDRVIPMLPERLSNYLCSLRPNEDKLCFSAIFEMTDKAEIINEWFGRTIIHSDIRYAYEEVQEIIEKKEGELVKEILIVNDIATKLREKRFENGSFSFETEEVKFHLDELGRPVEVFKKIRKEANMLIEDLMLLANKRVATLVAKADNKKFPFVYRVHEPPNSEKLGEFQRITRQFGYQIDPTNNTTLAQSFSKLLKETDGKPEQNFIQSLAIRSMSKARYDVKNEGHYGLAFEFYTHFTSPIRRYPDVMVHRVLQDFLTREKSSFPVDLLSFQCKHSSEREINAETAERASIKYKQVEFMQDKLGEVFEGIISGVIESGFFVEIVENKCEGFVPAQSLIDDYYLFDELNYLMKGYNKKKVYKLGQIVKIRVMEANLAKRSLEFEVFEK